ncbi:MAG: hypothetical protein JRH18_12805 [Deltaproteobacteria bacterium]|nr:hypothetical protein [Deltaproteobacteria bacterium]MBW2152537.1 hypothetical protein [Deltaproteobacteria bacterium]
MTTEKDLVLVYFEDKPLFFARVEEILPDVKPGWYHIKLLVLQVPLQVVTWILRDSYINGQEFTMGGKRMRMERVVSPEESEKTKKIQDSESKKTPQPSPEKDESAKVISFLDLKKQ